MNRRIRNQSPATKPQTTYLRFLKPGALAQLRDSKINARSHLRSPDLPNFTSSSPSRSFNTGSVIQQQQVEVTGALTADGELPFVTGRFYAPRCLQRKKLMAARSVCYLNLNSNSLAADGSAPVIDVL